MAACVTEATVEHSGLKQRRTPSKSRVQRESVEIGLQIGPTSARKTDPSGKRYDHGELCDVPHLRMLAEKSRVI